MKEPNLRDIPKENLLAVNAILISVPADDLAHLVHHGSPEECSRCESLAGMPGAFNNFMSPIWYLLIDLAFELQDDSEYPTVRDLKSQWKIIMEEIKV